jgi:UDP-glucose 4-epimerase
MGYYHAMRSTVNMGATYLVSGGAGFIGSHFVDHLLSLDATVKVVVVDNYYLGNVQNTLTFRSNPRVEIIRTDASDLSAMLTICEVYKPEFYFNFAVVPLPTSLEFPYWSSNMNFNLALTGCELARMDRVQKYVQISSSEVYGTARYVPMNETHPLNPETPYAASKAAADQITSSYVNTFGISAAILRPFNNYGPRQNHLDFAGVIPTFIENMLGDNDCQISGDGTQTRDFIYVEDTCRLILECLSNEKVWSAGPVNICSGREVSILEVFNALKLIISSRSDLKFSPPRMADVHRHCGDPKLMLELTGLNPPEGLNLEGLTETVNSYRKSFL